MSAPVVALKPRKEPIWLSPEQVCERVPGMTLDNLAYLRKNRKGPAFHKPTGQYGNITLYAASDVDEWVARSRQGTREQS